VKTPERPFERKLQYHAAVRALPLRDKIAMLIRIQERESQLERVRMRLGRPARTWRVWRIIP
jgi:hypothetical protein